MRAENFGKIDTPLLQFYEKVEVRLFIFSPEEDKLFIFSVFNVRIFISKKCKPPNPPQNQMVVP